jgi:hypothetical protein
MWEVLYGLKSCILNMYRKYDKERDIWRKISELQDRESPFAMHLCTHVCIGRQISRSPVGIKGRLTQCISTIPLQLLERETSLGLSESDQFFYWSNS